MTLLSMTHDGKSADWRQLCEQAAVEKDSKKLLELITEINRLLEEEQQHKQNPPKTV